MKLHEFNLLDRIIDIQNDQLVGVVIMATTLIENFKKSIIRNFYYFDGINV